MKRKTLPLILLTLLLGLNVARADEVDSVTNYSQNFNAATTTSTDASYPYTGWHHLTDSTAYYNQSTKYYNFIYSRTGRQGHSDPTSYNDYAFGAQTIQPDGAYDLILTPPHFRQC